MSHVSHEPSQVSSPGDFHPEALEEPDVNVSAHPAPIIQPGKAHQETSEQTAAVGSHNRKLSGSCKHVFERLPSRL